MSEWKRKREKELLKSEWLNDWLIEWMNEWLIDWLNEWMNEWMNDWMIEWLNDWKKEKKTIIHPTEKYC